MSLLRRVNVGGSEEATARLILWWRRFNPASSDSMSRSCRRTCSLVMKSAMSRRLCISTNCIAEKIRDVETENESSARLHSAVANIPSFQPSPIKRFIKRGRLKIRLGSSRLSSHYLEICADMSECKTCVTGYHWLCTHQCRMQCTQLISKIHACYGVFGKGGVL